MFPITAQDATIIAAALALVGVLLTAAVTYLGLAFRKSYDERSLQLREQEQRRLDIDTVVSALRLFSTERGDDVSRSQRAGAFLTLAKLGHLDFALTLLEAIWPQQRVDPTTAVWLVNEGLCSDSPELREEAAGVLRDNAALALLDNGHYCWPRSLRWRWRPELPVDAREALLQALLSMVHSRPRAKWDRDSLLGLFNNLYVILEDGDPCIRAGAVRAALALLTEIERNYDRVYLPTGPREVADLRTDLEAALEEVEADPDRDATIAVRDHIRLIDDWLQ